MKHYSAIIGYGGMGSGHHHLGLRGKSDIEVIGAYDIRPERMELARQNGLIAYNSLDELLADEKVELVTIATPNDVHKELAIACLRAGKNVISEKPVTIHSADLEEIIAVAKETGKLFSVHQNRRWDDDYIRIKKILSANTLGKPFYIESRVFCTNRGMYGWRGYAKNGGGMLHDWGVHLLDQLLDLIDSPVVSVDAHVLNLYTPEVNDTAKIFLRYENGMTAICEVNNNIFIRLPRWHVCCEHGTAAIEDFGSPAVIKLADTTGKAKTFQSIVYTENGPVTFPTLLPQSTTVDVPSPDVTEDWSAYYKNIAAVLDGTAELIVRPEQCLRVIKVIELALQSQAENRAVSCHI